MYILIDSGFLTSKLNIVLSAVFFLLTVVVYLLTLNSSKKTLTIVGVVLALIIIIAETVVCYYLIIVKKTIEKITTPEPEYTKIGIYGIDVSKDTLGMLYDTQIDYYFRVNFDGFKAIINALGGVNVNSEYSFSTGRFSFTKGVNFLNGEQALAFARERYSFAGGDRQRGKNQMEVIKGVAEKLASPALLKNYKNTLNSLSESFGTNAPYDLISYLIRLQLDDNTSWNIVSYSANGVGDYDKPYSLSSNAYVMRPDMTTVEHAKELINQVKNGEVPTP